MWMSCEWTIGLSLLRRHNNRDFSVCEHNAGIIGDIIILFSGTGASRAAVNMKALPSESLAVSSGNPSSAPAERLFSQTNTDYI